MPHASVVGFLRASVSMRMFNNYVIMAFLLVGAIVAYLSTRGADTGADSSAGEQGFHAGKRELRLNAIGSVTKRKHDENFLRIVRDELELRFSDTPDLASLDAALEACMRLKSTSSIKELLADPKFGWDRMSETTLLGSSRPFDGFSHRIHEALFERWGELDLEEALTIIESLPEIGDGDFDEGMVITFNLYKGAAGVRDGQDVMDILIPPESNGFSEHELSALGYLIEGWARSDPDAAWNTFVTYPPMRNAHGAIEGYLSGLPSNTDWVSVSQKDQYFTESGSKGEFRRNLVASWIRDDPTAALNWSESNADVSLTNHDPSGRGVSVDSHAVILTDWLEADPVAASSWMSGWESDVIFVPGVLKTILDRHPDPEIRVVVERLLQKH